MSALPRLIALSPGTLSAASAPEFLARLEQALGAGLPGVLLREPRLGDREYLCLAQAVLARRRGRAPWLALHDRAHLAHALGADAVHLSFRSLRPAELRGWLAAPIQIGLSTHAADEPAAWAGADYLFHGPLHATSSKPGGSALGLAGLARAGARARVPVLALGGVAPADVAPLRARGLHGVAVLSGILAAPDPAAATRAYLAGAE